jgi:glutathione S-transferase
MALTVCGLPPSPFFRKICTQLNAKGIAYETEALNPFKAGEEFTVLNPLRRIPLLKDSDNGDDFVLPDSTAIFQYIERKHPETPLMPTDLGDYGRALWFEEYADTEMAMRIGLGVFRTVMFPQMAGKEPDFASALEVIREKLPPIHDYLENELGDNDWFVGNKLSLADISIGVQYGNLAFAGYTPSADRWPRLAAFMKRLGAEESFAKPHVQAATLFATMKQLEIDPAEGL